MNKERRKQIDEAISKANDLKDEIESILNDEEEYKDNMPENLQASAKYEKAEAACESLQTVVDALEEAVSNLEEAQQ